MPTEGEKQRGYRLREARENAGYDIDFICREFDKIEGTIKNWENGNGWPSEKTVNQLCILYRVDKKWLLKGQGEMNDTTAPWIKRVRCTFGLSFHQMAELIGISVRKLKLCEYDFLALPPKAVENIFIKLQISKDWITSEEYNSLLPAYVDKALVFFEETLNSVPYYYQNKQFTRRLERIQKRITEIIEHPTEYAENEESGD